MIKKVIGLILAVALLAAMPVQAQEGQVIYGGRAQDFIFEPGSDYSPTDLFPEFKDVMPGDILTQRITVRNEASNRVKVKIYIRSLGAQEGSEEFLSQLSLMVYPHPNEGMGFMFDAAASEPAQLSDWVCLGTLYSGGEVDLDLILDIPVELDDRFQNAVGYLDWEFKVEEFRISPDDPELPSTGDTAKPYIWGGAMAVTLGVLIVLVARRKKKEN